MVVALLGMLKAGGAYVPLDPPTRRSAWRYMLADSAPVVVLMHGATREAAGAAWPRRGAVMDLDADAALWAHAPSANLESCGCGLTSRNLAYVIYTSGSTGKPKGVWSSTGRSSTS